MTEYLAMQPPTRDPFSVGPRENLEHILSLVALSRNGDHRFLPLLMNKMAEVLPRITNPMLQNAPENANLAAIDIFDGFGNAGMGQPPMLMPDFDRKFPDAIEEFDKKFDVTATPESASNSTASPTGQPSDVKPFASPSIVSPNMDYMAGFACTPMPDMMNPMPGQPHMGQTIRGASINPPLHSVSFSPRRHDSFHMQPVGDFQHHQRTDDAMMGIGPVNGDLSFGMR